MNTKKFLFTLGLVFFSALGIPLAALAACTVSVTPLNFGAYDVFDAGPRDSTATVTYKCSSPVSTVTITLDRGRAPTFNQRQMVQGPHALNYNLYLDTARSLIWGDGTGGTRVYSAANPPANQSVTVTMYGRIPARQKVRAGVYSSTVAVTINF